FEHFAENFGSAISIELGDVSLSYAGLNSYSNQVSHALIDVGLGLEDISAVFMDDDLLQVISLLGVFKSGSVYLPIDKKYKENHWSELYNKLQPKVLLTTRNNLDIVYHYDALYEYTIPEIIVLDLDSSGVLQFSVYAYSSGSYQDRALEAVFCDTNANVSMDGETSSYIFFTSGSTGAPKAVLGSHKSLSHFIHWESKELGITDQVRLGQLTSFSFDASLRDVFVPLINGGTICLASREIKEDISLFSDWLSDQRITILHTVPTLFRLLCSLGSGEVSNKYKSLKYLLLAGEKLYTKDILNWRSSYGTNTELINLYGATESTLVKSFYRVDNDLQGAPSDVLCVGQPISNTALILLNSENELCKVNEIGDIYIKTPFLSKGYYKSSALTAAKFIQNPLSSSRDIIYKTGDYGKYDSHRNVVVLGREDGVIKLNGVRADINSIEGTILSLEEVDAVKCIVDQGSDMDTRLFCFYTSETCIDDLVRTHSLRCLSSYEVPSFYIHLESFPVNTNGKTDTGVLKEMIKDLMLDGVEYQGATNEVEQGLIELWEEILGIDQVGIKDNFLLLGGNSIKLIRLKSKINKVFGVSLSIQDLFVHSVLELQATLICNTSKTSYEDINVIAKSDTYRLSPSQYRIWVLSQLEEASVAYNMPRSVELDKEYNLELFKKSIISVIDRHESLRTVFVTDEQGEPYQKILDVAAIDFNIGYEDFRTLGEEELQSYIVRDSHKSFDLEKGPLLRASLLQTSDDTYVFYYNMHHIISDGWSTDVLINDIVTYYNAYTSDVTPNLPDLRIQYKDYAAWKVDQLDTDEYKEHQSYWLNNLSGELPLLDFPSYKARPQIKTYNGRKLSTYISSDITGDLNTYCQEQGGSLFMGLLAVWNILCYKYTAQKDIIIGTPVAGRNHSSLEDQIGFYVNTLPLRNQIDPEESFDTFYRKIKDNTLKSYGHQEYPFD
ncbi:condensation domain-containing protein, partial [uncultured Aquimarina sp.]|uniref:condensation domain-containing protein n=1 Tax=uncultured Aquimarina sp. TaxID=575652 RepID=UPI00261B9173